MPPRYITRRNYDNGSPSWWVRVPVDGKFVVRNFTDRRYGSWRQSARAAIFFRNEIAPVRKETRGVSHKEHTRFLRSAPSIRNNTGVSGVYWYMKKVKSGKRVPYYIATIPTGKYKKIEKHFSTLVHGDEGAFELAVNWRFEMASKFKEKNKQEDVNAGLSFRTIHQEKP